MRAERSNDVAGEPDFAVSARSDGNQQFVIWNGTGLRGRHGLPRKDRHVQVLTELLLGGIHVSDRVARVVNCCELSGVLEQGHRLVARPSATPQYRRGSTTN